MQWYHVFTNLEGITEAPLPLPVLQHSGYTPKSWRHSQSSSITPLSDTFHLGLQLNHKHHGRSIRLCPYLIFLQRNNLSTSHPDFPFFQNKMYRELMTFKQGSKYTTTYVLNTRQLPLQVAHTCIQLRQIKRQVLLQGSYRNVYIVFNIHSTVLCIPQWQRWPRAQCKTRLTKAFPTHWRSHVWSPETD